MGNEEGSQLMICKQEETRLASFKKVCKKYLVIKDDEYIDVIFGTIFANRIDSKPVWLYLVGPPGSGKTEIVQTLTGSSEIYAISQLTANTLISGKILEEGEKDPSLLKKLAGKTLIIKDFTALLSGRRETLMEIMGQLRDAYDGTSRKVFGTGKDDEYESKFGVIAAVTNVIDKNQGKLAALGERFITYRCPAISEKESRERCNMASKNTKVKKQEEELREAAESVLNNKSIKEAKLPDLLREKVIDIASFVARGRCPVFRDKYSKEAEMPVPEVPTRLTKQLGDLAVGIAMAREKSVVTNDEIKVIQKVALDCLTLKRISLLKCLLESYPEPIKTACVAEKLKQSVSISQRWLEDLLLLSIVVKTIDGIEAGAFHKPFSWCLEKKDAELLREAWP